MNTLFYCLKVINNPLSSSKISHFLHFSANITINQQKLRSFLIKHKPHECIICDKKLPLCILEAAHLKPVSIISEKEKNNYNIVEFMCRYCHSLYDNGLIGVNNGFLEISPSLEIDKYDLTQIENKNNKVIYAYNKINYIFFDYHYLHIYSNIK